MKKTKKKQKKQTFLIHPRGRAGAQPGWASPGQANPGRGRGAQVPESNKPKKLTSSRARPRARPRVRACARVKRYSEPWLAPHRGAGVRSKNQRNQTKSNVTNQTRRLAPERRLIEKMSYHRKTDTQAGSHEAISETCPRKKTH